MKPIDFPKILFRVNVAITGIVFILLAPTFRIYAWWFPEKESSLWLFPLAVLLVSSLLWMAASLSMPWLIRKGWFEDRRSEPRPGQTALKIRLFKSSLQLAVFLFHMLLLIGMAASLVRFMRSDLFDQMLQNMKNVA